MCIGTACLTIRWSGKFYTYVASSVAQLDGSPDIPVSGLEEQWTASTTSGGSDSTSDAPIDSTPIDKSPANKGMSAGAEISDTSSAHANTNTVTITSIALTAVLVAAIAQLNGQ